MNKTSKIYVAGHNGMPACLSARKHANLKVAFYF